MSGLTKVWRNAALPAIDPPVARTGEVAEWSNVPDSKSGVGANPPWVRIPPSPPTSGGSVGWLYPIKYQHSLIVLNFGLIVLKFGYAIKRCSFYR